MGNWPWLLGTIVWILSWQLEDVVREVSEVFNTILPRKLVVFAFATAAAVLFLVVSSASWGQPQNNNSSSSFYWPVGF